MHIPRFRARSLLPALLLASAAPAAFAGAPNADVASYPPAFFAAQHPANAAEMLQRVPGFTLDYGSGARGLEGSGGNVLIDGARPTTKADNIAAILTRIPAANVERIDLIRGGAPGIDMQGKAVVANVILRKSARPQGEAEARTSRRPRGGPVADLALRGSGPVRGGTLEGSFTYGRGFSGLLGDGVGRTQRSDGSVEDFAITSEDDGHVRQATAAYDHALAHGTLKLNGLSYRGGFKLEQDDVGPHTLASVDQRLRNGTDELGGAYSRGLGGGAQIDVTGLHRSDQTDVESEQRDTSGSQTFRLARRGQEDIARIALKRDARQGIGLEVAAEYAENRLHGRTAFLIDGLDIDLPAASVSILERRTDILAKASWRVSPTLALDGQVRYERSTLSAGGDVALAKTLSFVKPRLLATWSPNAATQVRLRAEREVGQLDFDAFVARSDFSSAVGVTAGNPALAPARAWVGEIALEQRFWDRGALTLTATHAELQDVVDRGPVVGATGVFDRPTNIGSGTSDVIAADLTLPLVKLGVRDGLLKAALTRRWSSVQDPATYLRRAISGQHPVDWSVKFSQDLPARHLTWGAELYGGWEQNFYRFNAIDQTKLDPFVMTYLEWKPRPGLGIRIEAENLTERGYRRTTVTYPGLRGPNQGAGDLTDRNYHYGRILFVRVRKSVGG